MFQSGYLTITEEITEGDRTLFRLDYPNQEVRSSLNYELLDYLKLMDKEPFEKGEKFCALLRANDFDGFADILKSWLSGIPYQWHNKDFAEI